MTATAAPTPLRAGDLAPDFTLPDTSGGKVTLSSFRGQRAVLLCFFPFAFSEVCTAEFCEMRDTWDQYAARGVAVFPVSVDSHYALREFRAKYGMQVELLSDFDRTACAAYGTLFRGKNFSNRAYFLVDAAGVIRWAHVEEHPGLRRSNDEVLSEIGRLG